MNESLVILDIDDVIIRSTYTYTGKLSEKYRNKLETYCDNCTINSNETIVVPNEIRLFFYSLVKNFDNIVLWTCGSDLHMNRVIKMLSIEKILLDKYHRKSCKSINPNLSHGYLKDISEMIDILNKKHNKSFDIKRTIFFDDYAYHSFFNEFNVQILVPVVFNNDIIKLLTKEINNENWKKNNFKKNIKKINKNIKIYSKNPNNCKKFKFQKQGKYNKNLVISGSLFFQIVPIISDITKVKNINNFNKSYHFNKFSNEYKYYKLDNKYAIVI